MSLPVLAAAPWMARDVRTYYVRTYVRTRVCAVGVPVEYVPGTLYGTMVLEYSYEYGHVYQLVLSSSSIT